MPPTSPTTSIVRAGFNADMQPVPVKGNPNITKIVHHENFQGGYLVGLSVATHAAGEECGKHNHRGAVEQFFVLEGFGVITIDGVEHKVQPGDSVLVPVGATHNVTAAPFAPFAVQCMLVIAPGHEDDPTPWAPTS